MCRQYYCPNLADEETFSEGKWLLKVTQLLRGRGLWCLIRIFLVLHSWSTMSLYPGDFCNSGTNSGVDLYPGETSIKLTKINKETIQCILESTQRSYNKLRSICAANPWILDRNIERPLSWMSNNNSLRTLSVNS